MGATAAALKPLVNLLREEVIASSEVLHGDDTPVPILAPGTGKTKPGRLWTFVRDERPYGGKRPPAAVFFASSDRRGERPLSHLATFSGVLQADGYAGFNGLYEGGRIVEAACWAHTRRKFFDVHAATGSAVSQEALERIGTLYEVERSISGKPPDERRRQRQARSRQVADALKAWAETILPQLSGRYDPANCSATIREDILDVGLQRDASHIRDPHSSHVVEEDDRCFGGAFKRQNSLPDGGGDRRFFACCHSSVLPSFKGHAHGPRLRDSRT